MSDSIFSLVNHELYLITTKYRDTINGQIATWVTRATLSTSPLRFIVLISKSNYTYSLIKKSRRFVVHMLSEGQHNLVPLFGLNTGRVVNKFENLEYGCTKSGLPVIEESCGWFESVCLQETNYGDRSVLLAEAVDGCFVPSKKPLRKFEMMNTVTPEVKEQLEQKAIDEGIRDARLMKIFSR